MGSRAKLPVANISYWDQETSTEYVYAPQQDISPFELSKIMQLFMALSWGKYMSYDVLSFLKENSLLRHFVINSGE